MELNKKKILVTGADGFIGSHLTESLVKSGFSVRALVLYNSFGSWGWLDHVNPAIVNSIEIFSGDIRDPYAASKAVEGCSTVLHLAALISVPYSYQSPEAFVATNVQGTLNMLQAARANGVAKFVHTSTSEVYGTAAYVPIDENHPLQAQSPYAASKIAADQLALSFYRSFELPVAVIRPFNTYGPRQSARAVIAATMMQIAAGKKKIRLGALHPTRDFTFVADTVRGFMAIAESDRTVGEVVNIGSDFEISIGDVVAEIARAMNVDVEITLDEKRLRPEKSEVDRLWSNNLKARELTGWKPLYVGREGFARGIRETADWFGQPQNRSSYKADLYAV